MTCLNKPKWGGETAIGDNRLLRTKLDPAFVKKCENKEIRYWNCLHGKNSDKNLYQSWQMRFKTDDKGKVNEFLKNGEYGYYWEGNTLFYWRNSPPTITHVLSGEQLWFNQITSNHGSFFPDTPEYQGNKQDYKEYSRHSTYGDGEEFRKEEIDDHRRCNWESCVGFDWQNGDILFVDQLIVEHSRLSFEGERRVGISLLNY